MAGTQWMKTHQALLSEIGVFCSVVKTSIKLQLTYRTAMIAGLITNFFWSLLRVYVIAALYQGQTQVNSLSLDGAITYIGLSQAFIAFLTIFGSYDLMMTVYTGEIAGDLSKPIHIFSYWLYRDFGRSVVNFLIRAITGIAAFALIFTIVIPGSISQWILAIISLGLAWVISFSFRFIINLISFWTPDARGFARMAYGIAQLFTGMFIPLRLFPEWFSRICYLTPFPSLLNTPIEIYLGVLRDQQILNAIIQQILWCIFLVGLSLFVLRQGIRRLVVQGG